jgi:hypothetical protein
LYSCERREGSSKEKSKYMLKKHGKKEVLQSKSIEKMM